VNSSNQKSLIQFKLILDVLMSFISFGLAYYIRFYTELISRGIQILDPIETLIPLIVGVPILLVFYNLYELYNPKRHFGMYESFTRITRAMTYTILIVVALLFVFKIQDFSRWTLVLFYGINIVITTIERMVMNRIFLNLLEQGKFIKTCLVLGDNVMTDRLLKSLKANPSWGYQVIGILDDNSSRGKLNNGVVVIGKLADLKVKLSELPVDIVMIAFSGKEYDRLGDVICTCEQAGVKTQIVPYYYQYVPARPYMDDLDGLPVIDTRHVPLDNFLKSMGKRIFDIVFSLVAIALSSPILLLSYIMIKLTSPGPVVFKQERIGLDRKPFMMYKFRSMVIQDDKEEVVRWTTKNDPRKTPWGNFMRKTSIDELPQFFNVLKGDMSVVGPRPERPYFVEQFKETIPKYMIKHQVRPGITGWAQINGWRGDTSIEKRIEHDLHYIENWKMSLDVKIVILTVIKGFVNRNAY